MSDGPCRGDPGDDAVPVRGGFDVAHDHPGEARPPLSCFTVSKWFWRTFRDAGWVGVVLSGCGW